MLSKDQAIKEGYHRYKEPYTDIEIGIILELKDVKKEEVAKILSRSPKAINMIRRNAQRVVEGEWEKDKVTNQIRDYLKEKYKYLEGIED